MSRFLASYYARSTARNTFRKLLFSSHDDFRALVSKIIQKPQSEIVHLQLWHDSIRGRSIIQGRWLQRQFQIVLRGHDEMILVRIEERRFRLPKNKCLLMP